MCVEDAETTGTAARPAETPRSYVIDTEKNTVIQNHAHITPSPTEKPGPPSATEQGLQDKPSTPVKPLPSPCLVSGPNNRVVIDSL